MVFTSCSLTREHKLAILAHACNTLSRITVSLRPAWATSEIPSQKGVVVVKYWRELSGGGSGVAHH